MAACSPASMRSFDVGRSAALRSTPLRARRLRARRGERGWASATGSPTTWRTAFVRRLEREYVAAGRFGEMRAELRRFFHVGQEEKLQARAGRPRATSRRILDARAHRQASREAVDRLELPFNALGVDPYGISKRHLRLWCTIGLAAFYRWYFSVEHARHRDTSRHAGGRMLVGNHSGGIAIDAAMVIMSCLLEMDPPRLAQGMVEKFINRVPS